MITRRALLTVAAVLAAVAVPFAAEDVCCNFDHELNLHALDCPVALARTCDDCGSEPGEECHFSCSGYWR